MTWHLAVHVKQLIQLSDFQPPISSVPAAVWNLSSALWTWPQYKFMSLAKYFGRPYKDWFEVTKPIHPRLTQTGCFLKLFRWKECKILYFGWLNSWLWEATIQNQYRTHLKFQLSEEDPNRTIVPELILIYSPYPSPPRFMTKGSYTFLYVVIHSYT